MKDELQDVSTKPASQLRMNLPGDSNVVPRWFCYGFLVRAFHRLPNIFKRELR